MKEWIYILDHQIDLNTFNVGVMGLSFTGTHKKLGQRRSWRGGTDCKSVVVRLSRFDSYLTHKILKEETRCLDVSRIKEHQPSTVEVLIIKLVSRGDVTARKLVFRMC